MNKEITVTSEFLTYCNRLHPLTEPAAQDLLSSLTTKIIEKGDYLLREGEICRHLFFIEEGLVKTYFNSDYKEFIMRFFPENSLFSVLDSFLSQAPSTYRIVALERTMVSCISRNKWEQLCSKHHCIEGLFRRLLSTAAVHMMKRISEMLEENATQRYHHFITDNEHLIQRINLGDLASYLGITQVSLSRIRAAR